MLTNLVSSRIVGQPEVMFVAICASRGRMLCMSPEVLDHENEAFRGLDRKASDHSVSCELFYPQIGQHEAGHTVSMGWLLDTMKIGCALRHSRFLATGCVCCQEQTVGLF
jgi:hypothetical protein